VCEFAVSNDNNTEILNYLCKNGWSDCISKHQAHRMEMKHFKNSIGMGFTSRF